MGLAVQLHQQLSAIASLASVAASEQGPPQHAAFGEMAQRAAAYAWTQRQVVLPALRAYGWKAVRSDFLIAAVQFHSALAAVLPLRPGTPAFSAALTAFRGRVAALIAANEAVLWPALERSGIGDDPLAVFEAGKAFDQSPRSAAPFDSSAASALALEASVVLPMLLAWHRDLAEP